MGHPAKLTLQALRSFINGELEQLESFLDNVVPLLRPGARAAIVTTRRIEAALVKRFVRKHESSHPLLEAIVASGRPDRLQELYPLLQTQKPFAVQQACEPFWPTQTEGRRGP